MRTTMIRYAIVALVFAGNFTVTAQTVYSVKADEAPPQVFSGHLKLGTHRDPAGNTLDANSQYFVRNGKPWYPVMGEVHFSRVPKEKWESSILKLKAAGIDVIASYIFWIHHEEEEGKFDWSGNKDLRAFAELCKKHRVFLFTRIGPWCHGEVRNGGLPDFIVKRGNTRRNDSLYLSSVRKLYGEIGKQLNGLYFKDGGPVIGTQIENEFRFNSANGLQHMLTLKAMAISAGIDVPYYTATGWPGSDQKQDELLPVWGAYPEAPWDKKTTQLALSENYVFSTLRNDPAIGSDLLGTQQKETATRGYRYPYATAEMGGGNQVTYHRRPIINAEDVSTLAYVKTGSGANLMGYYMFQGGSNPIGAKSTMQESRATKYPNDYTLINYDFQSPIGEWGETRKSYREFKVFHTFLNEFGDRLVSQYPYFPTVKPTAPGDNSVLRFSVRAKDGSGFVFISNMQRQLEMKDHTGIQFKIQLPSGVLTFPEQPITIRKGLRAVLPFNMDLDGALLSYATTQPLCRIDGPEPLYVFFAPDGLVPEYRFGKEHFTGLKPGSNCLFKVSGPSGKMVRVLTLTEKEALDCWKARIAGKERLFLATGELTFPGDRVHLERDGNANLSFSVFPAFSNAVMGGKKPAEGKDGIFTSYSIKRPVVSPSVVLKQVTDIQPYRNTGVQFPSDERDAVLIRDTGPLYQTNLTDVPGSAYYELSIPTLPENLSEAYLSLAYSGDTGSLYLNGKLVADDFYMGLPMTAGLKEILQKSGSRKLLFQVVPLAAERKIYFEPQVREQLAANPRPVLRSAVIVPKYAVDFSGR